MMNSDPNNMNTDWEHPTLLSGIRDSPPHSSGFMPSSPSQNSTSSSSHPGERSFGCMPEFGSTSPESPTLFYSRNGSLNSFTNPFSTISSQDLVSNRWQPQGSPPFGPIHGTSQPNWNENNSSINLSLEDGELEQYDFVPDLISLSIPPIPLNTPQVAFDIRARPDFAVQVNPFSGSFTYQTSLPTAETHNSSAPQYSIATKNQSPCRECAEISCQENEFVVHWWTKHAPPTGSPYAWTERKCMWRGCFLKNTFKTAKKWSDHAYGVHLKRYWCNVSGCTVGRPFGTPNILKRHNFTVHETPKLCTKIGCQAPPGNLRRKDKSTEHDKKWHGPLPCDVTGCLRKRVGDNDHGFSTQTELDNHKNRKHLHVQMLGNGRVS